MARKITYRGKSKVIIRLCELVNDLYDRTLGDMLKSTYDTNDDGIVNNSDLVNGFEVHKNVPADAQFTDTVYDDTYVRERVTYLMNNMELIMSTLFRTEFYYLIDSEGDPIIDANGHPIYTAKFYDMLSELREAVEFLRTQNYVLWDNPQEDN
ncbi:MAG: hypothetical protein IJ225_10530 [Solobacterium sp.]|nr:hypothetical protein [Solobacterium sp.]